MQTDLVVQAQAGDPDAYSALTAARTDQLFAVARLILGDSDRAADAVQDALLSGWLDLRGLRDPERFDAWLRRILVRTCYAAAKRHRTRRVVEINLAMTAEASVLDTQAASATHDQLKRAFAQMSNDHRTVIVLVHYLGLSLSEAATVIGVPLGTIQSRLSRATQVMRSAIEADDRLPAAAREGAR